MGVFLVKSIYERANRARESYLRVIKKKNSSVGLELQKS